MVGSTPSWGRRIPWGLLGMLALLSLGEAVVWRLEPTWLGIEPWDWRQTGQAATGAEVRSAAVLCLGDSLVKLGIQPRVLADRLGRGQSVYNLALCAGRAPATYFLLRRALRAGSRPTALIVDFDESGLGQPPEAHLRLYSELLQPGETCELAWTMHRPDFAGTVLASKGCRALQNRFEIRQVIAEAFLGMSDPVRLETRAARALAMQAHWRDNLGAQVMPPTSVPLSANPADWSWVQAFGWRPDPTNAAYLNAFLELAGTYEIPVFWLLPPLHPGFTARQIEVGSCAPFDAFVASILARFPAVTVVDGRRLGYDASLFIDMAHLDGDGSTRLSRVLGSVVADRLAHPGPQVVFLAPNPVQQVSFETANPRR